MPTPFDKLRSDDLRADPLFKLAVGRAPESGRDLCSQPTMSRLENAPSCSEVGRLTAALVAIFCRSFDAPPAAITLDIDETCDPVHGHQQLSLFHGFYDTRCFLPVHVYHVETGKPVAVLLRPGKTPSGVEVRTMLKHLTRRIRRHWPRTRLTFRGDSHYGRTEAMAWCGARTTVSTISSAWRGMRCCTPSPTRPPTTSSCATPRPAPTRCAASPASITPPARGTASAASSPGSRRRPAASTRATSSPRSPASPAISTRGSTAPAARRHLIKQHKAQLASDRTSCQSPLANQFRLVLHTAAYWLMLALRDAVPCRMDLAWAEFATIRQKLLKIGARVIEKAARVRIHFASACPAAAVFRLLAGRFATSGP